MLRKGCSTRAAKPAEAGTPAITYAANSELPWRMLTATSTPDQGKTIDGNMRLYSVEKKQQQMLEGHIGNFGAVLVNDSAAPSGVFAFIERETGTMQATLRIVELPPPGSKVQAETAMPPEAPSDFAAAVHVGPRHGVVYKVTKAGDLYIFTVAAASMLVRTRVSQKSVFISVGSELPGGSIFVNWKGQALSGKVSGTSFINYVGSLQQLGNRAEIACTLARRFGLLGAGDLFQQQFY